MKKIAYLAPEIPALSATFVYNEILALEKMGYDVNTYSIHYPKSLATDANLQKMRQNTVYLYKINKFKSIILFLKVFLTSLRGIQTFLICLFDMGKGLKNKSYSSEKYESISLLKRIQSSIKLLFHYYWGVVLAALLKQKSISHLHIHFAHVPTQIGMYSSMISNIPFTFTSHANDIFERGFLLKEKVERSLQAITISKYNKDFLVQKNAVESKICIIHCGVDSSEINDSTKNNTGEVKIGCLGRLVEKKGIDILIQAFQNINNKNYSLLIAGDGPLKDSLITLADQSPYLQIRFIGNIQHYKVNDWIKTLDCFVLACKEDENGDKDGIPVVLMEAMNLYIPVVSTEISAIPELIENKVSGLLAKPNDSESLKKCIEEIIKFKESEKKEMLKQAKQKILDEFDLYKNTKRLTEFFQ